MLEAVQVAVTTLFVGLEEFHVVQHYLAMEGETPEYSVVECLVAVGEVPVAVGEVLVAVVEVPVAVGKVPVVVEEDPVAVAEVLVAVGEVPVV